MTALEKLEANLREHARLFTEARIGKTKPEDLSTLRRIERLTGNASPSRQSLKTDSKNIRAKLEAALCAERKRARSGSMRYDFNRHLALHQAIAALDRECGRHEPCVKNPDVPGQE